MKVEIFGKAGCVNCSKAVALSRQYQHDFEYKNIGYKNFFEELVERDIVSEKDITIQCPMIFIYGQYIGGVAEYIRYTEETLGGFGDQPI
jgi:glutaredoxin